MPRGRTYLKQSHRQRWLLIALLVLVLLGVGLFAQHHSGQNEPAPAHVVAKASGQGVSTHMLFVGDVFWGRTVQTAAERSGLGYSYITHGLSLAERREYNAWIANFECPVTTRDIPLSDQINNLQFNCRPEYLPTLAKWFTAASQANNHSANNGGAWGLDQTRFNLQAAGIQNFGTYDMSQTNDICEVIAMPAETTSTHAIVKIPVALCGYMYVSDVTPTDVQLDVMKQYAKVMPVIAFPHMGIEYRPTAEPAKVSAYHRMIDAGADAVIGAHPHVIENSENYKGRLIAYSTGNFLFDQQILGRATDLGLGVGIKLTIPSSAAAKIDESIGSKCAVYKDDCLQLLQQRLKRRPVIKVAYNFTCFNLASGVTRPGSRADCADADRAATIDRLGRLSPIW